MIGFILGFITTLLTGYLGISIIERELELRFRILFAIPLGFGINSILYFIYLCLNINDFNSFIWFELALTGILAIIYYNEEKPNLSKHKFKKLSSWFYLLNLYAIAIFFKYFINNPLGSWDGFRIWNTKAEFLFLNNPLWKNVFTLPHFMSHNDYPMMLPSLTARLWNYTGIENPAANVTICLFFTFGLVYLLHQAIAYFKSEKTAIVTCSAFMILDIFLVNGAAQCADIPLAYMIFASIICLFFFFKKNKYSYIILATIFASLSAWTKNEGVLFFAIFLITILSYFGVNKNYKNLIKTIIIAIIPISLLFAYKTLTHSANDLIAGFFAFKSYNYILDFERYWIIIKLLVKTFLQKFSLLFVLLLLSIKGFKIKKQNKTGFILSIIITVLTICGYLCVYLLSPHDVYWLVNNSIDRLILQLLPTILFLYAINLRIGKPDSIN